MFLIIQLFIIHSGAIRTKLRQTVSSFFSGADSQKHPADTLFSGTDSQKHLTDTL